MLLDLNFTKLLVLGVIALIVFGPERLPAMAAQAGRALREMRKMLDGAKSELQENLGPEFSDFDIADLNPRHLVRKHLMDEITGDGVLVNAFKDVRNAATGTAGGTNGAASGLASALPTQSLLPGERPPFDADAT
ncbi:MAG: sec-independent translocase [Streptosporangiaceae bacterium]